VGTPDDQRIELRVDTLQLALEPQGALISAIDLHGRDGPRPILYAPTERPLSPDGIPLFGLWPMLPFANRCERGRLLTDPPVLLPLNEPAQNRAMHGCGWQRRWRVEERSQRTVVLSLSVDDYGVYHFDAVLTVVLDAYSVDLRLTLTNRAALTLPVGCGFHPWFPYEETLTISVEAPRRAVLGPHYAVEAAADLDAETDFRVHRPLPVSQETTIQFLDWAGRAEFHYPGRLRILLRASERFSAPLLWRPADAPFLCFEPQSHCIAAASDARAAMLAPLTSLAPGETLSAGFSMTLTPA